jgi:hypothetical protein
VDKYLLHHSGELLMPLLHICRPASRSHNVLLWFSNNGKPGPADWPIITKYLDAGYELVSFDFRGLGETRMTYKALSPDDPLLSQLSYDAAYVNLYRACWLTMFTITADRAALCSANDRGHRNRIASPNLI